MDNGPNQKKKKLLTTIMVKHSINNGTQRLNFDFCTILYFAQVKFINCRVIPVAVVDIVRQHQMNFAPWALFEVPLRM